MCCESPPPTLETCIRAFTLMVLAFSYSSGISRLFASSWSWPVLSELLYIIIWYLHLQSLASHSSPSAQPQWKGRKTAGQTQSSRPLQTPQLFLSLCCIYTTEGSSALCRCLSLQSLHSLCDPFLVLEAPSLIFIQVEKSTDFLRIFLLLMCITKSFHPSTSPSFPCCFAGERSTAACPQSQRVFLCPVYFFCVHPLLTQQEGEGWPPTPAGRALLPAQYKTESAQPNQDSSVLNIQA